MGDKGGSSPPPVIYSDPQKEIADQLGPQLKAMNDLTAKLMETIISQSIPPEIQTPQIVEDEPFGGRATADTKQAAEIDPDAIPTYKPEPIDWTDKIDELTSVAKKETLEDMTKKGGVASGTLLTSIDLSEEEPGLIKTLLGGK